MDWAAIGGVAAVVAALIAWLQLRHSKSLPAPSPPNFKSEDQQSPLELLVEVREGKGSYRFPADWRAPDADARWPIQEEMEYELKRINFASVLLKNGNKFPIGPIDLELAAFDVWSAELSSATSLARTAVKIEIASDHVLIKVAEMPAEEILHLSILGGGFISNSVASANAAIKPKKRWIFEA